VRPPASLNASACITYLHKALPPSCTVFSSSLKCFERLITLFEILSCNWRREERKIVHDFYRHLNWPWLRLAYPLLSQCSEAAAIVVGNDEINSPISRHGVEPVLVERVSGVRCEALRGRENSSGNWSCELMSCLLSSHCWRVIFRFKTRGD
jgi:hypothetical protein